MVLNLIIKCLLPLTFSRKHHWRALCPTLYSKPTWRDIQLFFQFKFWLARIQAWRGGGCFTFSTLMTSMQAAREKGNGSGPKCTCRGFWSDPTYLCYPLSQCNINRKDTLHLTITWKVWIAALPLSQSIDLPHNDALPCGAKAWIVQNSLSGSWIMPWAWADDVLSVKRSSNLPAMPDPCNGHQYSWERTWEVLKLRFFFDDFRRKFCWIGTTFIPLPTCMTWNDNMNQKI